MTLTGNKGEWSEIYAFLRLLADGKLYAADKDLNRIGTMFFPLLKIIREEVKGSIYEYCPDNPDSQVKIYLNDSEVMSVPTQDFDVQAQELLDNIIGYNGRKGSFGIVQTESFIRNIYVNKLKAPSSDKSDIQIQLHDTMTGYKNIVGFSIKSELGSPPTLLNASGATNFTFSVSGLDPRYIEIINNINTRYKVRDRINAIRDAGGMLNFENIDNNIFSMNLMMIDSQMPVLVAAMLELFYSGIASNSKSLTNLLCDTDPLELSRSFYQHKTKELLSAIALGMKPATAWSGSEEASGGYIIVKTNGDVLAFHLYNRDSFRDYLLNNTKFDTPSVARHRYAYLYEENGSIYIKLNLQIRFI